MSDESAFEARLQEFVGKSSGPPSQSQDEVNQAMIRHWVEAVGDENPVYTDDAAARAAGFPGVIAPPTMLQAWIMHGFRAHISHASERPESIHDEIMSFLDSGGFTSVVATDCEQDYKRSIVLGDRLSASSKIEAVSGRKKTALGEGYFLTTLLDYCDADGEVVATMRFRILKFRPAVAPTPPSGSTPADVVPEQLPRPMPALTQDNAFFFEGASRGELLIQRCTSCGTLRHPPRPGCPKCRSLEWDTVVSTGRGTVFSFVVVNYPQVPAFDYPLPVVLVELEEGTRLISNIVGIDPSQVKIGMPVEVEFQTFPGDLTLPLFHPADAGAS